jgi:hypothetical protein
LTAVVGIWDQSIGWAAHVDIDAEKARAIPMPSLSRLLARVFMEVSVLLISILCNGIKPI